MSKTVTCPACRFAHPRRPDGICPRCAKPRKSFRDARPELEAAIASFVPAASQGR